MRIDVKKFLFIGLHEDREKFFKSAQRAGIIHFIDSNPTPYKHIPEEVDRVLSAIKIVRSLPVVDQEEQVDFDRTDEIVDCILRLHEAIDKGEEKVRILKLEIARVGIFGDFSKEDIAYIDSKGHRKIQFFCIAQGKGDNLEAHEELIYVGSEYGLDYFVAINPEPRQYPGLVELKIDKPLGELTENLRDAEHELVQADARLKTYTRFNEFLHEALNVKLNHANFETAKAYAQKPMDDALFAVEGWVPVNKVESLRPVVRENSIHCEEVAIEPKDTIPTYLQNEGAKRIGEDLIGIYDTPAPTDKDPSVWVLCFFALFFAMIIGDAGYGLVFLATALYFRRKYPDAKGSGKRFLNLVLILSCACILWGVLNTAFFGMSIGADNPLRKVSLVTWLAEQKAGYQLGTNSDTYQAWLKQYPGLAQAKTGADVVRLAASQPDQYGELHYEVLAKLTDQIFLEMVLFIAMVHVALSMMRYITRNWSGVGWILFLIGAYLYVPWTFLDAITFVQYLLGIPPEVAVPIGLNLIMVGFPLAVLLGIFQHKLLGLVEIMAVVQIFADVMSYLRLYALGLAGSIVSATLNEVAGAVPFVLAVVLIVLGHIVNMIMSIASGVIHGLRLNFLEWYHYSFTGGGRPFQPLKLLEVPSVSKQNQSTE